MRKAEVYFEWREAVVTHEKDAVTINQMQQAVARYGFTARLKSPNRPNAILLGVAILERNPTIAEVVS